MKRLKRVLYLVLSLVMALSMSVTAFASTENTIDQTKVSSNNLIEDSLSVESYKNWITSQINKRDSNSYTSQILLKEFNNLTEDKQELFVSYISDSDLLLNIINLLSSEETYATLENGDIVVSSYQTPQDKKMEIGNKSTIQYRTGTGTKSVSVLGIKVFEYSGEIRYSHDGSSIKEIQHANIWISRNFIPFINFSWSDESTYGVGTSVAHHIEYCTWSFVHEKLGLTYGSHQIEITGSVRNVTTFGVY